MSLSVSNPTSKLKLTVALNHIDYTVTSSGPLDNTSLPKVPIIRVFGNSSLGPKACVHIHQVFPYFCIEYLGSLHPRDTRRYIHKLTKSLNHAIALSLKRNPESPTARYIRAIILVKGIPFYGFHSSYSPFLKVFVCDPALVNRTVTILRSGSVMSTRFRIYESHLSFPLQFMCDFGLYGCGFLDIEGGWERCMDDVLSTQPPLFEPSPHFRQSRLPLEVDVIAPQILNRHGLSARDSRFKIGEFPSHLPDEKLVLSVKELWEDESNRRRARGLNPSPEIPVDPSDLARGAGSDWVAEARYWEAIRKRVGSEGKVDIASMKKQVWEYRAMSTFESIEALWEDEWRTWRPKTPPQASGAQKEVPEQLLDNDAEGLENVEVDLGLLSGQDLDAVDEPMEEIDDNSGEPEDVEGDELDEPGFSEEEREEEESGKEPSVQENPFKEDNLDRTPNQANIKYRLQSPPASSRGKSQSHDSVSPTPTRPARLANLVLDEIDEANADDLNKNGSAPSSPSDRLGEKKRLFSSDRDTSRTLRKRCKVMIADPDSDREELMPDNDPNSDESEKSRLTAAAAKLVVIRTVHLSKVFQTCNASNSNRYQYSLPPPTRAELNQILDQYGVPHRLYQPPYYSDAADVPDKPREYGGLVFRLKGNTVDSLEDWGETKAEKPFRLSQFDPGGIAGWEYASHPPSVRETRKWLAEEAQSIKVPLPKRWQSQIEGPTQANIYGFKNSPIPGVSHGIRGSSNFTILSLEVFVTTEGDGFPDSETDEIVAVFYALQTVGELTIQAGVLATRTEPFDSSRLREFSIQFSDNEMDLLNDTIDKITELDPDIITGWEIQRGSWGYLTTRSKQWGLDVSELISRAPPRDHSRSNDQWGFRKTSTFQTIGRHVLNAWRIMRSEHTLTGYSFENVAFHVLQRRFPKYSIQTLNNWYRSPVPAHTSRLIHHMMKRTCMVLEMLEESEVVTKSAEFARIFGVDFFSVISRGSQFKVESFMFRIAKPESFVLISPSKDDVGRQNAAECMPLIMEPTSALYTSPLVVLDFQSLYPSIMIAYNYCYSTCLGRVQDFQGTFKLGVDKLDLPEGLLGELQCDINVAPNGIMYVKSKVRRGLLGRMLTELLDTRVMVKQAMKGVGDDKALKRVLDARQLALKYIANVTYGYTSATFSGRMPAVEIADSIVQSGRETLEKAIMLVNSTKKWNAQVMYGDTDSMFIYLRGRTKEEAFRIGYEIADTVTAMNPAPIRLKFEKVYFPCVLMAKKRYVGFKYESVDATEPGFDAKGIETVRRDGVLAQRKMTENCLKLLFRTQDLSKVKEYCYNSWTKLLENRATVQDFIFAKEVRMGTYSDNVLPPPGVMVAGRKMLEDPNYEPQYAERVPYLITKGSPGSRLVDRAMDPADFVADHSLQLDAEYYIQKVLIPPLERIFNLVGADVRHWYHEMPKAAPQENASPKKNRASLSPEKPNIDESFGNMQCLVCDELTFGDLCEKCDSKTEETMANVGALMHNAEKRLLDSHLVCVSCTGSAPSDPVECESLDCPWFYARQRTDDNLELVPLYQELTRELAKDMDVKLSQSSPLPSEDAFLRSSSEETVQLDSDATRSGTPLVVVEDAVAEKASIDLVESTGSAHAQTRLHQLVGSHPGSPM